VPTAPAGRGSIYLDESQGSKQSRDLQERSKLTFLGADAWGYFCSAAVPSSDG
jgi:hypothetical protein